VSFKDVMNGFLNDVNGLQQRADESIKKLASGEITDVHQVMTASEEAKVAFNMMMEIRNKVMDAYQEVLRIRL
jgi:flagellar hook-basal body complex protein FliE